MDIQRLRNLTTGRLHTKMEHIYEDIALITCEGGMMTHQLPNACHAMEPYLREMVTGARFWDGEYDPTHTGEIDVPPMDKGAQDAMWERYGAMLSLLASIGANVELMGRPLLGDPSSPPG
jgi:hypothetical protein